VRSFVVSRAVASEEVAREVEHGELSSLTLSNDNTVVLDVEKMKCAGCSAAVKKVLEQQDKVIQASVNLITGSAVINIKDGSTKEDIERIIEAVNQKGFPTALRRENSGNQILSGSKIEEEARDECVNVLVLKPEYLFTLAC
jgi:cation transport ATPase